MGAQGVKNQRNHRGVSSGKKPLLKEEQILKLKKSLESRPSEGGIWTGQKVARRLKTETGIEKIGNQRGWDYLKKSRYSCQNPIPKHRNRNPLAQEKFIQNLP